MYSCDTKKAIINLSINQLVLLKNSADSKKAKNAHSDSCLQKEKILLVEGKTDIEFWKRILSDDVFINDVKDYADSVCALLGKSANNKFTVIIICEAINSEPQSIPDSWIVNGVIDRDFDDQTYDIAKNLHVTDTHDLETMLIYSDSGVLQNLSIAKSYGILITNEQANTAKRLSLQMGWVKMACKTLPSKEKQWLLYLPKKQKRNRYRNQEKTDYALLNEHGNFDILQFLRTVNNLQLIEDRKDDEYLRTIMNRLISTSVLKNKITADGKWLDNTFNDDDIEIWKVINGHDFLGFLKSIVHGAERAYRSNYQADNALEFDLIESYDIKKFDTTRLYRSMRDSDFIEHT